MGDCPVEYWDWRLRTMLAQPNCREALADLLIGDGPVQAVREMRASRGAGLSHWHHDAAAAVDALDSPEEDT